MDVKDVKKLVDAAKAAGLSELTYESGDVRITIRRDPSGVALAASQPHASASGATTTPADAPVGAAARATATPPATQSQDGPEVEAASASHLLEVTAPIVGTFYGSPTPDAAPYVKVGDKVQAGAVLCIIEAMKLMNEIEAEASGTVTDVLVRNEEPVEYGQVLFRIDPD